MNKSIRLRILVGLAVVCAFFLIPQRCAGDHGATTVAWSSPRMREIEKEWQSLWDTLRKSPEEIQGETEKAKYGEVLFLADRLFRKHLSEEELRQLAASSEMVPISPEDRSRFTNDLLAYMVKAFVKSGDRKSLVELLSKRCPARIDWPTNIEFFLAARGTRLKDPIMILGEAYLKCQVPETRHTLAAAVRRAFAGCGIRGKDDADFVRNAMRWYEREKDHLAVNDRYTRNESVGPSPFTIEVYEEHPEYYENPPEGSTRELLFEKPVRRPGVSAAVAFAIVSALIAVAGLLFLSWWLYCRWRRSV